jgi:RNA polymerase sigma factor (sigma-70 family)
MFSFSPGNHVPHDTHDGPPQTAAPLLVAFDSLVGSLYVASRASSWGLTLPRFAAALERSAGKRFNFASPWPSSVPEYLRSLCLEDLALASACMEDSEAAWEYFVREYRGYLRAVAGAITKGGRSGADARQLADSLFAELYGLTDGKRGERSLLRYYHGRSALKTWLRAVLAQRHIDYLRESCRWESLDSGDGSGEEPKALPQHNISIPSIDPHREKYAARFAVALEATLVGLDSADRRRLELYYARQMTLAEIGRSLGEHESSVSRHLDQCRRELRARVEEHLRRPPPLSDAEIALCFQYAAEDAPIDLRNLFPQKKSGRPGAGRKESS